MSNPEPEPSPARTPLSRERVLRGAMAVADDGGLTALTIRSLAQHLGVKPMAVYHHVANKEAILDGIVDLVFAEFAVPSPGGDWRAEMRRRSLSVRSVLRRAPLGDPAPAVADEPGPGDGAAPRREHRHPARGRLLGRDDGARLRADRQLRLRFRALRGVAADQRPGDRRGGGRPDDGDDPGRGLPVPRRVLRRARDAAGLRLRQGVRVRARPGPGRTGRPGQRADRIFRSTRRRWRSRGSAEPARRWLGEYVDQGARHRERRRAAAAPASRLSRPGTAPASRRA